MLRRALLSMIFAGAVGCATAPPPPVVWYIASPVATPTFPHGDLNSPLSTWEKIKDFPTPAECQDALRDVHNQLRRPVDCVASNDPRLSPPL